MKTFEDMPGFIWLDDKVVPWKEARIHVMTHSLHYASSVFEGIRAYNGKVLFSTEHYERLHKSANLLDLVVPYSVNKLVKATENLIKLGNFKNAYIRAINWCGNKTMKISNNNIDIHTAIAIWENAVSYPKEYFTDGIKLNIAKWRRPDPATAPVHAKAAGLYTISSMSKVFAENNNYYDSLMLGYHGAIAETTGCNIFLVIDNKLYTPIPDCFLDGITRQTVIKLARRMDIEVIESRLELNILSQTQEVFLTGTATEILPVGSIEGKEEKWQFKPGEITYKICQAYKELINNL